MTFRKVNPATLGALRTSVPRLRLLGSGRTRTLTGQVKARLPLTLPGSVRVEWQSRRGGKWKKVHGGVYNAGKPFRFAGVDVSDARVRIGAAQNLSHQHAGQINIGDIFGIAGYFVKTFDALDALADNGIIFSFGHDQNSCSYLSNFY